MIRLATAQVDGQLLFELSDEDRRVTFAPLPYDGADLETVAWAIDRALLILQSASVTMHPRRDDGTPEVQ